MRKKLMVLKTPSKVAAVVLGVVIVGILSMHRVAAQSSTNNPILAALNVIQGTLDTLQSSVDKLIPPAETNVKSTPPLIVAPNDYIWCTVENVSQFGRYVEIRTRVGLQGPVVRTWFMPPGQFTINQPVQNGRTEAGGEDGGRCTFTVIDGAKSEIRASVATHTAALAAE